MILYWNKHASDAFVSKLHVAVKLKGHWTTSTLFLSKKSKALCEFYVR